MIQIDNEENRISENGREATLYKCPICRNNTHKPWFRRPRNLFLINVLENEEEYLKKTKDKINNHIEKIPDNLNFSLLCLRSRKLKLNELYDYIVPLIYQACLEGKGKIIITDKSLELNNYSKEISTKLFDNYSIYKIESTKDNFIIYIVENTISNYNNEIKEHININYHINNFDEEEMYSDSIIENEEMYEDISDESLFQNMDYRENNFTNEPNNDVSGIPSYDIDFN